MASSKKKDELVPVVSLSRDVIESYIFATSHHNLSIYSERLLLYLVEAAQCAVYGLNFRDGSAIRQISSDNIKTQIAISVKDLLGEGDNSNYTAVKNTVRELMSIHHEHEEVKLKGGVPVTDKDGRYVYEYTAHQLLNDVEVNVQPGMIVCEVNRHTWNAMLNFAHGFRRYDLLTASKLKRVYALRIFKIISNQRYPISFTVDELKAQWGIQDKYPNIKDFIKCLDTAKEELDRVSSWTFEYEKVCTRPQGRLKVTSIRFYPIHQTQFDKANDITRQLTPSIVLGKETVDILVKKFGFPVKSIKSQLPFFNLCRKTFGTKGGKNDPSFIEFLSEVYPSASRAVNPQGYLFNALKIHLKEKYGIVFKNDSYMQKKMKEELEDDVKSMEKEKAERGETGDLFATQNTD